MSLREAIDRAGEAVLAGGRLAPERALPLLAARATEAAALWEWGHRVRRRWAPQGCELCAVVSVRTGGCSEDCAFCAQARVSPAPEPDLAQVLERARRMARAGVRRLCLVASGRGLRGNDARLERLAGWAARLRHAVPELELCASLGLLDPPAARRLRRAGVTRYNHNLETAPSFFSRVVTSHTLAERLATIRIARRAGLELCAGGILGLGESLPQRVELAAALRELPVTSVPLNLLDPRPGTPLAGAGRLSPTEALNAVAVFRLLLPDRRLRLAGGREAVLGACWPRALRAGADSLLTGGYLTTSGNSPEADVATLRRWSEEG